MYYNSNFISNNLNNKKAEKLFLLSTKYEGWNFNSDNYLFTTDTK